MSSELSSKEREEVIRRAGIAKGFRNLGAYLSRSSYNLMVMGPEGRRIDFTIVVGKDSVAMKVTNSVDIERSLSDYSKNAEEAHILEAKEKVAIAKNIEKLGALLSKHSTELAAGCWHGAYDVFSGGVSIDGSVDAKGIVMKVENTVVVNAD